MPGPVAFRRTDIVRLSPDSVTGGRSNRAPVPFVTSIVAALASMASERVTLTDVGVELYGRIASGRGSDETLFACAVAAPGRSATRKSAAPTRMSERFMGHDASSGKHGR